MQDLKMISRPWLAFLCFMFLILPGCGGGVDHSGAVTDNEDAGTVQNQIPVANAGLDQDGVVGVKIYLNGAGSVDGDGDPLTYQWEINSATAALTGATTASPVFTASSAGDYEIILTVHDGKAYSASDSVKVVVQSVANTAPMANAGPDRTVHHVAGSFVVVDLDGRASVDDDGDVLTYTWAFAELDGVDNIPGGSNATIETSLDGITASFEGDKIGLYHVTLTVDDGQATGSDTVVIEVLSEDTGNTPPVAVAVVVENTQKALVPGATITLNGIESSDDTAVTGYQWWFVKRPTGSAAVLTGATAVSPSFIADLAGEYQVGLQVFDDEVNSTNVATVTVTVAVDSWQNTYSMSFNRIAAGIFTMGSPDSEVGRGSNENQAQVILNDDYYLMTTELTQGQWQTVMGTTPSTFTGCSDCPVETVSWVEAQGFISTLNNGGGEEYRLPSEAEWEYAARAGTTEATYGGNLQSSGVNEGCEEDLALNPLAWYCGNVSGSGETQPVGGRIVNPWGLYDMLGNVQEWTGELSGSLVVARGGGWNSRPSHVRAAYRWSYTPDKVFSDLGFRLVMEVPVP